MKCSWGDSFKFTSWKSLRAQYNICIIFYWVFFFFFWLEFIDMESSVLLCLLRNSLKLILFPEVLICRRRHKSDCLCAICVLKRRRKEREENARLAKGLTGASDNNYAQETKQEVQ